MRIVAWAAVFVFGFSLVLPRHATAQTAQSTRQYKLLAQFLQPDGRDADTIRFYVRFTNLCVNTNTAYGTIQVQTGVPSQMAVLVNSTNVDGVTWQAYSPSVPIALGATDGVYSVWVGLRGRLTTSQQTWFGTHLTLDRAPPIVVITNPVSAITSQPIIQMLGYSPEPLHSIRYDVINASKSVTNQEGGVTEQFVDPITIACTTNWFECPDIDLALGTNTVVLRVTDLAGNLTVTNIHLTLDYSTDTTPPALTLYYPQNGDNVCGRSFTVRGLLDDPTATVMAQIVDTYGDTNNVKGLVEVNGLLWVENLPLAAGANTLTLIMTDAAGNSATTNLTVIGLPMNLTIDKQPAEELIGPTATITGTIDSADYIVVVNGMEVTNYTDNGKGVWKWSATDVPIAPGGTAVIHATAVAKPNRDSGTEKK